MLGGPVFYIGLCVIGWVMLWARPIYGFLLTYALGMLAVILLLGALYGSIPASIDYLESAPDEYIAAAILGLVIGIAAFPLMFSIVGVGIVALRKSMKANE